MTKCTALVTDSTCNLPADLTAARRIYTAPLYVLWGEETFKDGIDLTEPEFFRRLVDSPDIPKTSQVSPKDFTELFEHAREVEQADEVVCAVISSDLSGTYASAIQAQKTVDFPVRVIDTRQTSWALGHPMLAAADARDAGASPAEIEQVIRDSATRQRLLFTVESLEYLHRGGRIGNARRLLGSALSIKPLLILQDGVIDPVDNVRTRKRALERMLKHAEELADGRPVTRLSVLHGDCEDEANTLLERAIELLAPREVHLSYLAMVLGVHTGPGVLGVSVEWSA
ncbi:MAG: DegV family protein [Anaerolineae bacterium]|nr:DegV family protein [Anaerolineae bacterium]